MLVNFFLEDSAKKRPDKVALVIKDDRYTYRDIDEMSDRVAAALVSDGLGRGERAVVLLENSMEAVVSIFGVLKAGGVFLMVNPSTKEEKLAYILNNCRASALISSIQRIDSVRTACAGTPSLKAVYLAGEKTGVPAAPLKRTASLTEILQGGGSDAIAQRSIDADLATVIYTSGSTGNPKGVMMTHLNMVTAANSITGYLENTEDDIILNTLPLSFDYGLYQVLMAFKTGATVILEKSFTYPYKIINTLMEERVTGFPIVPTISAILLQMDSLKSHRFERLRYITNTADALPLSHIHRLRKLFPRTRIFSMYGLTECKRVSYLPPDELDARPASVGKAIPNTEVYIVDENGSRVGPGVIGELVVRGSHVMRGYWEMPEETAKKLRPGETSGETVLYTGDLFKTDPDGYLYFVARRDNVIKSRGEKVSPKEVENVLYEIDSVVEAAVIGEPDPIYGQSIKAFIVLKDGSALTETEILAFCSRHLEDHMVPQRIEFVKELPKTDTGKIKKTDLGLQALGKGAGLKPGAAN